MGLVESQSSIPEDYLYFYRIVSSKNCPERNVKSLMWKWTLPEVVILEEHVDMMDAFETAVSKDVEAQTKG